MKRASLNISVKAVDPELKQIRAVFSTANEDRHGEIVDQKGWDLTNFLNNPVVLWGHDQTQPPIGKVVDIAVENGNLEGTLQFAGDIYPFADLIYNLMAEKYLNAISVGFMNTKWQYDEVKDQLVLLENELYEVSVVNVPANALALAKSKGVDISLMEKRVDKATMIHDKILEAKKDEKIEEPKPEEKPEVEVPKPAEEQPAKDPAEVEGGDLVKPEGVNVDDPTVNAEKALEVLLNSESEVIRDAVKKLSSTLDASVATKSGSKTEGIRYSKSSVNRLIRQMHNGKKSV